MSCYYPPAAARATLLLLLVAGLASSLLAQLHNPYAQFGHNGYVATTAQERAMYVWTATNPDASAAVRTISVDGARGQAYRLDEAGAVIDSVAISEAKRARFMSVDPLAAGYPWYTPYQFAGNKPIIAIDLDGGEEKITVHYQEACCTGAEGLFRTVKTETQIASQMSFTGEHRKAAVHAWFTSGTTSEQNRRLSSHMHVYVVAGDKPGEYKIREAIYKDYPMLEKYRDGGYDKSLANLKGIWDSDLSRAVTPDFLRFTLSSDAAAVVGAKEVDEAVFVLHGKEASTSPRYLKTTLATVGPQAQVTIAAVGVATTNYSGSAEDISIDLLLTGKGAAPTYGVQFSAEEGGGVEVSGDLSVIQDSNGNLQTVITTGASVGVGAGAGAAITVGETKLNEPK